ncbi:hypothetical protein AX15_001445 [Amanita polypyramis BW_CC]|nr:hypothetical protein AX15_001445 [Amanita polypyramis BW_CC]
MPATLADSAAASPARARDGHPFPMSSQPSPAPHQRSNPSVLSSSSASISSHPLSPDALLRAHSAAQDPKLTALEQAINERNTLSAQNSQLWKLIEKQRAGYNQILKELERIRGERDMYKARLGINSSSSKRDRTHKHSLTQQSDDHRPSEAASLFSSTSSSPSRKTSSASLAGHLRPDPLAALYSLVAKDRPAEDANTNSSLTMASSTHPAVLSLASSSTPHSTLDTYEPHALQTSTNFPAPNATHLTHTPQSSSASTVTLLSQNYPFREAKSPKSRGDLNSFDISTNNSQSAPIPDRTSSRSPRTGLPEEAQRYITNVISHVGPSRPSPRHKDGLMSSARDGPGLMTISNAPSNKARQAEFLDMDDEDEEEIGVPDGDIDSEQDEIPSSVDARFTDSPQPSQQLSNSDTSSMISQGTHQSDRGKTHAAVDDFPLPPSNIQPYNQQSMIHQAVAVNQDHVPPPSRRQELVLPAMLQPSSSYPQHQHAIQSPQKAITDQSRQAMSPQMTTHFRALPLLSSDLPTTSINVSHSFVRPNDRGKEVLSFVVHVNPGNGKSGWKVEKMYSDVLSLDQRVRQSVGKGVGKKIANLPEGKLWKDHAPAKVDQRKAVLEHYLQILINLPVKSNDEVIAFFTTDIVRETKQPVMQVGHKEGYLTKRGKNFGGWKTRYFVLQGPVLEYYDCRGGAHLGSITITGAQIGRQQRSDRVGTDDDNEYRHAFLIVEAKKGPGGHHPRHVLCAESDEERDSWVDILVRYFSGTYSEDPLPNGIVPNIASGHSSIPPRVSSSSTDNYANRSKGPLRNLSRDEISISKGSAVPISQLTPDANNAKFFQISPTGSDDPIVGRPSSPTKSINYSLNEQDEPPSRTRSDTQTSGAFSTSESIAGLPSSLPEQSMLSISSAALDNNFSNGVTTLVSRANSELGHYSDLQHSGGVPDLRSPRSSPEKHRPSTREQDRKSFHPASAALYQPSTDRIPSPDKLDSSGRMKISGPMNGTPIPSGFKFGGHTDTTMTPNDRREKAKSRSFWGFGKANGDKQTVTVIPRAVFGVPLEESLEVAQICNLPAIVFRAIQYLEAKKADQEEGVYRLSGSSAVIKSLKDRFNAEGDVDLLASDEYWDPHAIAGLLKSYLRELPASILTRELHLRFLAVIDFVDPQERIRELSGLIAALPLPNYTLLRALTAHLILIVQNSAVNKMTMRNVGIVFSPTLGIPAGVFSLMLGEFNRVFNVDADNGEGNETDGSPESSDLYRRNSRRYSEAAADQLLGLSGRSLKAADNEDTQSDGDDMVQDGENEMNDGDTTKESLSSSNTDVSSSDQAFLSPPETPTGPRISRASHTATSRGLNVTITPSERGYRYSGTIGSPASPQLPRSPHQIFDA